MVAILDLLSIDILTNDWVDWSNFLVAHWGDLRKVPFDDQRRRSSNMAAAADILDLVSVDYLTNACVDWFIVVINLHHIPLLPKPPLHKPTDNFPLGGICHALRSPCLRLFSVNSCPKLFW
jgi:hypothetical protein